jgi:hypothetical protein
VQCVSDDEVDESNDLTLSSLPRVEHGLSPFVSCVALTDLRGRVRRLARCIGDARLTAQSLERVNRKRVHHIRGYP